MALSSFFSVSLPPGDQCGDHAHENLELVYADGSDGMVWFGDRKLTYSSGSVLIHPAKSRHRAMNRGRCRHLCLGLKGPDTKDLREAVVASHPEVASRFLAMAQELGGRQTGYRTLMELMAQEILILLRREQNAPTASTGPVNSAGRGAKHPSPSRTLEVARTRLDQSVAGRIDLETLSEGLFISKDYLRHAFKKEYGVSPMQYLIRRRIEKAQGLLDTSDLKTRDIAEQCGFETEFYFSRLFKQVTGVPPTAWRRRELRLKEISRAAPAI